MKRNRFIVSVVAAVGLAGATIYWRGAIAESHELQRRRHQILDVELACRIYADKHGGRFPGDLRDLGEVYGKSSTFFARVVTELELVVPADWRTADPDAVLIREKTSDAKGRRMVGYVDGHFSMLGPDGHPASLQPAEPGM